MLTPELAGGVAGFCVRCQTYEGGFGGEPGNEAHGGYAFCALAALVVLGAAGEADLPALALWCASRQVSVLFSAVSRVVCHSTVRACQQLE